MFNLKSFLIKNKKKLQNNLQENKVGKTVIKILQRAGLFNGYNVYWSRYEPKNFGDWVTPYLYKAMNENKPLFCAPCVGWRAVTVSGAGSIFRHINKSNTTIVWGSGIISKNDQFNRPKNILAVRGPLTRQSCLEKGFDCPQVFGDPAILLPMFYKPKYKPKFYKLGIIPHYINYAYAERYFKRCDSIRLIDVTRPLEAVIDEIVQCEMTLSGSLHGLIVSHAYGIRSTWVEFGKSLMGDQTKFHDYFQAFDDYSAPSPVSINETTSFDEMMSIANRNKVPDHELLRGPLLAACPFFRPNSL